MKLCISKEQLNCLHLTKETRDEVLKELEPRLGRDDCMSVITDNDRELIVRCHGWSTSYYHYNNWYVKNYDGDWERYTDEEFKEQFELVEE